MVEWDGVEGSVEVVWGVELPSGDIEGVAIEGVYFWKLDNLVVGLFEPSVEGHIIDSKKGEMGLFIPVLLGS